MVINIWVVAAFIVAVIASIAAWLNTKMIKDDLSIIKEHLGIKEERPPSIFDKDLDKD